MRILNASGCLDALATPDLARTFDAFVTKTVTLCPREGNPPVRIAEVGSGMVNSIGLANPGIDAFRAGTLPELLALGIPVWVSVGGSSAREYADLCERLDADPIEAIELNVSCPNVESPSDATEEIVSVARAATSKPLYAKLSPQVPDVAEVARAAESAGADGLSLVNTLRGLALERRGLRPALATVTGGLSGPALRPVALAAVYACRRATTLPIVGMGGVETGRHALELAAVGAADCALGTILFRDPWAAPRVRAEVAEEARALGLRGPFEACAVALEGDVRGSSFCRKTPANARQT